MLLALLGLLLTALWLGLAAWYVGAYVGFDNLLMFMPHEIAEFIGGLMLPVVFMWLVLGYFGLALRVRQVEQGPGRGEGAPAARREARTEPASMQGSVTFHPVDLRFFDELIEPLIVGEKVNPEEFLAEAIRIRQGLASARRSAPSGAASRRASQS